MIHFYKTIDGWCDFEFIYKQQVKMAEDGARFVEVGSFLGKSACYMAVEIINSGKNISFDTVDSCFGTSNRDIKGDDIWDQFTKNIEPVKHVINPRRMTSMEAVRTYENRSLDFVFIDACHNYEEVLKDLHGWWRKIRLGGVLAGHDLWFPEVRKAVKKKFRRYAEFRSSWLKRKRI